MNVFRYRNTTYQSADTNSFPSNPEKIGPGIWFYLQLKSRHSNDDSSIQEFLRDFELIIQNFPCMKCRKHMLEYVRDHNPNSYVSYTYNNQRLGMFRYIWEFHNTVNSRLGKPLISWEDALRMFSAPEHICTHCDANKEGLDLVLLPGFVVTNKETSHMETQHNTQQQQQQQQQDQYIPPTPNNHYDYNYNGITVKGEIAHPTFRYS